jgi:hypothetical protein
MKTGSVLALCPGFFATAPAGSYSGDLSEQDHSARMLVSPESVYGTAWSTSAAVVEHVVVVVREAADWLPPGRENETARALESEGDARLIHHHEAFFNGSLILATEKDKLREERRYRQLLNRTTVSWINNCSTPATTCRPGTTPGERRGGTLRASLTKAPIELWASHLRGCRVLLPAVQGRKNGHQRALAQARQQHKPANELPTPSPQPAKAAATCPPSAAFGIPTSAIVPDATEHSQRLARSAVQRSPRASGANIHEALLAVRI